jgi:hypothetical protein
MGSFSYLTTVFSVLHPEDIQQLCDEEVLGRMNDENCCLAFIALFNSADQLK